ncbi:MAG: RNA 2',3'-cyclic phosphodiesterase [Candidatus Cloacimonas sp.]
MIRTFIALELPNQLKKELENIITHYARVTSVGVNWVKPENLHLTLLFIGDVQPAQLAEIEEALTKQLIDFPAFNFTPEGLEFFPAINPHLLWLKLSSPNNDIFKLNRHIGRELSAQGILSDNKAIKLHITLARLKINLAPELEREIMSQNIIRTPLLFDTVCLYKSQLMPEGPKYTILNKHNLLSAGG